MPWTIQPNALRELARGEILIVVGMREDRVCGARRLDADPDYRRACADAGTLMTLRPS